MTTHNPLIFKPPWESSPDWRQANRSFDIHIDRYRAEVGNYRSYGYRDQKRTRAAGGGIYTGHFIELAEKFDL